MNILVTGGAGYIGSITCEHLIEHGHKLTVVDNLVTGHRQAVHPEARFEQLDIADSELQGILERDQIEAVIHFAAFSLVADSMAQPLSYFRNNTLGSLQLLASMQAAGVNKFILSSTASLYGSKVSVPIKENSPVQTENVYAESKYLIERSLHWLQRQCQLGYVALRYFNASGASEVYGEDHQPESHLIPLTLQVAMGKRQGIAVFGDDYPTPDGTCIRDYIHVLDLAAAHRLAVEALQEGEAHTYNLGTGTGFSVQQVIDVCRQVTGHAIPHRVESRRIGDPPELVADSQLIRQELGWQPRYVELHEIVRSAWRWHQQHPEGYA